MGNSKIVYYGETLIDLTGDTVEAAKLLKGVTAHDKKGEKITGTFEASAGGGFVSGTITPASSAIQTITHNLGKQPTGIAVFCSLSASSNKKMEYIQLSEMKSGNIITSILRALWKVITHVQSLVLKRIAL